MAQEFRYPLTRICLRSGSLTLPLAMLEVFPDDGDIVAVDGANDAEFPLRVAGRTVAGLDGFFRAYELDVNDEVRIRPLEDGRFAFTAAKRDRRPDYRRPDVLSRLIDQVVESEVPATEAEIRALHPDVPADFPLREALENDPRLTLHEGRWQSRLAVEAKKRAAELEAQRRADDRRRQAEADERAQAELRAATEERARLEREEAARRAQEERAREERDRLNAHAADDAREAAQRQRAERDDERRAELDEGDAEHERFEWDEPIARGFRLPWQRQRPAKEAKEKDRPEQAATSDPFRLDRLGEPRPASPRQGASRPSVVPTPRAGAFPGDAALNSASLPPGDPAKTKRAREAFASFGYRVEGLSHGQLMLHADLGRRQYRVLLHVLPDGEQLDWAALLARRRDSGAKYLAVVGDHRDLHRLTAPADLARATLWAWIGVDRLREINATVLIGPLDLEPHFERDGMFEYGLERFERAVAKRVQERGTLSAVLTALAGMRAPAVFLLEDLAAQGDVPRDQLVRVLDRLSEAPFQLISKIDSGEFCLRYRVHDALDQLSTYATSLRARLPERHRERVRGLPDDVEPIGAQDLPEGDTSAAVDASAAAEPVGDARDAAPGHARGGGGSLGSEGDRPPGDDQSQLFTGPGFGDDAAQEDEVDLTTVVHRTRKPPKR
jgi:hypothetical protein